MKKAFLILLACALPHLAWGQLMFRTTISGANEVPPRMTPAWGIGHATLDLDSKMFSFEYTFEGLLAPQTAAHIHVAPPGVNGPVHIPLPNGSPSGIETMSRASTARPAPLSRPGDRGKTAWMDAR